MDKILNSIAKFIKNKKYFWINFLLQKDVANKQSETNKNDMPNTPVVNSSIKVNDYTPKSENVSLYKRTKINKFVDNYVVVDIETTGFYPDQHKIIEISAIKYINNSLSKKFTMLVNPGVSIPKKITDITGIDNQMVQNAETIDKVLPKFINFIDDLPLIFHNGSFDLSFIEANIIKLNLKMINNKNIDTLHIVRKCLPQLENHKLTTLKDFLHLNYDSHRAECDCYTTNDVYQYCKNL